jgi:hypothetical protein
VLVDTFFGYLNFFSVLSFPLKIKLKNSVCYAVVKQTVFFRRYDVSSIIMFHIHFFML